MTYRHLGLAVRSIWLLNAFADATLTDNTVWSYGWDGILAYIPANRQLIQEKLDTWHNSISETCNGPRLYLPETEAFPGILDKDQHVVHIEIGYVNYHIPDKCNSVNGVELGLVIPLLSDDPKGPPKYSLALIKFYQRDRVEPPYSNHSFPYLPVDELTMTDSSVVMRNGSDEILLSFERFNKPCKPAPAMSKHELDEFLTRNFQFGLPQPGFSSCDRRPSYNQFCKCIESIQCDLPRCYPEVCETAWYSNERVTCSASVQITNISEGFRDFMMLGDGPIEVIAADSITGDFTMNQSKCPCLK
ncbi:hypothetical protein HOLleu_12671 [Holothuria leucospilota]|uniref:Uncharacterized protein n=1 Tax=Holothuria leucospilota TaxID=206669 RepID=A0A9Q1CBH1_HOLLE|nr:hypothetical protein HOLleu_12671 [Holothuria leucospilota]